MSKNSEYDIPKLKQLIKKDVYNTDRSDVVNELVAVIAHMLYIQEKQAREIAELKSKCRL